MPSPEVGLAQFCPVLLQCIIPEQARHKFTVVCSAEQRTVEDWKELFRRNSAR